MKKFFVLILISTFILSFTSACTKTSKKGNMIQSKRRFAQYVEPSNNNSSAAIDLSEGPKLKYDANLGPQNLNFDIKIVDPY